MKNIDIGNLLQVEARLKRCRLIKEEVGNRRSAVVKLASTCEEQSQEMKEFANELLVLKKDLDSKSELLDSGINKTIATLENALVTEHFILDCQEALALVEEKESFLRQSVHAEDHMLDTCHNKITGFVEEEAKDKDALERLRKRRDDVVQQKYVNKDYVNQAFDRLCLKHDELQALIASTLAEIQHRITYVKLCRESDELLQTITRQSIIASDENYGKNIADVTKLRQEFLIELANHDSISATIEDFVAKCHTMENVPNLGAELNKRATELSSLWVEVKELSEARREALEGAESVHAFDKSVDDMIEHLVEKRAIFSQMLLSQEEETLLVGNDKLSTFDMDGSKNRVSQDFSLLRYLS